MAGFMRDIKTVTGAITASGDVVSAVPGRRIKVVTYVVVSAGTGLDLVSFRSGGISGPEIWRDLVQGSGPTANRAGMTCPLDSWICATQPGEKLALVVDQPDTLHYAIGYFADDMT